MIPPGGVGARAPRAAAAAGPAGPSATRDVVNARQPNHGPKPAGAVPPARTVQGASPAGRAASINLMSQRHDEPPPPAPPPVLMIRPPSPMSRHEATP